MNNLNNLIKQIESLNPGKNILSVFDSSFKRYGMVYTDFKVDDLMKYIESNNIVKDEIVYIADIPEMRKELSAQLDPIINTIYAGLDVQVGVCYGKNNALNALEYHQGSEVYIVGEDMIMLLGSDEDIKWPEGTYDSSLIKFFYTPKGTVIELKGGCLHYAPVNVYKKKGFNVIVSLLKNTNTPLDFKIGNNFGNNFKDKLLIAKNSWFIAHPEFKAAKESGWHLGINGENFVFKTL